MKSVNSQTTGSRSVKPSRVVLKGSKYSRVVEFLADRFKHVSLQQWHERCSAGDVYFEDLTKITSDTVFVEGQVVYYHRWLPPEPPIPFEVDVIFEDDEIVVVNKPPFIPVAVGGQYINETVTERLRNCGYSDIEPAHRLDRMTCGLLLLTKQAHSRAYYQGLFADRQITKRYSAVTTRPSPTDLPQSFEVRNRLKRVRGSVVVEPTEGEVNAISRFTPVAFDDLHVVWEVAIETGFMHQIRCHLAASGLPIVNDDFYPVLQPQKKDRYNSPLMLRSIGLEFKKNNSDQVYAFELPHFRLPLTSGL